MGLGKFTGQQQGSKQSKSSGPSSSSSGPSGGYRTVRNPPSNPDPEDFPIYQSVCPEYVVLENDNGQLELVSYPETEPIWLKKSWYSSNWELDQRPEGWRRIWYSRQSFLYHKQIVKKESGKDLYKLLVTDAERALNLLTDCANRHNTEKSGGQPSSVTCRVCGKTHSYISGDYRTIDRQPVCSNHTMEDLHNADLL